MFPTRLYATPPKFRARNRPDLRHRADEVGEARGQDGVDHVVGAPLGDELVLQASPEEVQDVGAGFPRRAFRLFLKQVQAAIDELVEGDRIPLGEEDVDDAQGLATQGVGIGRSGRDQLDGEESGDRVHLVGDADDRPRVGGGKGPARLRGKVSDVVLRRARPALTPWSRRIPHHDRLSSAVRSTAARAGSMRLPVRRGPKHDHRRTCW